jgi:hypothetical protein
MLGRKLSKDHLEKMAKNSPYRVPLILSNTVTGKREEFASMTKAALFLGVHRTTVEKYPSGVISHSMTIWLLRLLLV